MGSPKVVDLKRELAYLWPDGEQGGYNLHDGNDNSQVIYLSRTHWLYFFSVTGGDFGLIVFWFWFWFLFLFFLFFVFCFFFFCLFVCFFFMFFFYFIIIFFLSWTHCMHHLIFFHLFWFWFWFWFWFCIYCHGFIFICNTFVYFGFIMQGI